MDDDVGVVGDGDVVTGELAGELIRPAGVVRAEGDAFRAAEGVLGGGDGGFVRVVVAAFDVGGEGLWRRLGLRLWLRLWLGLRVRGGGAAARAPPAPAPPPPPPPPRPAPPPGGRGPG